MDILNPFVPDPIQIKYLIEEVDYFTKWIEVEAMENITAANILKFFKQNIMARIGVPQANKTDNGT